MSIKLTATTEKMTYLDPAKGFSARELTVEKRFDPLTGDISRLVTFKKFRLTPVDWSGAADRSGENCPFCPENIASMTPRFTPALFPSGRPQTGAAIVIPNLSPYDRYTAVVIMTRRHYVALPEIDRDTITDSFLAGAEFLEKCFAADREGAGYCSINWNYMPYSGGTLIHPHLQVLAGPTPGNYHGRCLKGTKDFHRRTGGEFWKQLVEQEAKENKRYLGTTGSIHWLATFAPRALADITAVLPVYSMRELGKEEISELARGILKIIAFFRLVDINSFNASLFLTAESKRENRVFFRMVARFPLIYPAGSDMSYLQVLHADPWVTWSPEYVCREVKKFFDFSF